MAFRTMRYQKAHTPTERSSSNCFSKNRKGGARTIRRCQADTHTHAHRLACQGVSPSIGPDDDIKLQLVDGVCPGVNLSPPAYL